MRIENEKDLLNYFGAESVAQLKKTVFKGTSCGAWIEVFPPHQTWDNKLEEGGVSLGSIVEGVDQETQTYIVHFPCDSDEIGKALENVEEEAEEIWNQTHGCEHCWKGGVLTTEYGEEIGPTDYGMRPVDPDCPECGGDGVVI